MILESTAPEVRNDSPGPVSAPEKEAPLTDPNSLTTEWPMCECANCRSRVVEAVALRARAGLLRRAISEKEVYGVVCHHAVELLDMMEARGLA